MGDREGSRRTALVTGASSGIGYELALLLAENGHDIVAVARSRRGLDALAEAAKGFGASVHPFQQDLSLPAGAADLWSELRTRSIDVDVLVNNAGVGLYGPFATQDESAVTGMLQLNVLSLTTLTRLAVPGMLARRWGRILNVASVTAQQPGGPGMAAYYASKAYVLSFSRGLAGELRSSGVSVTALCPGTTRSAFDEASGAAKTRLYLWLPQSSPKAVARAGYRALLRQADVSLPGLTTKMMAFAAGIPPRRLALEVNRFLLREA